MTILLVDDDPTIRLAAAYALRANGHTVLEADDAASALALARAESIDLLLLDVVLDAEDGTALAAQLRALPQLAGVPLVFLTGRADAEREALLALGAAGVLSKPFDITTLAAAVEQLAAS